MTVGDRMDMVGEVRMMVVAVVLRMLTRTVMRMNETYMAAICMF